jgi:bacteriochlorophyll 4-vinyl reductase
MKAKAPSAHEASGDGTDELVTNFLASNVHLDVRKGHVELMGHRIMLFRFEFLVAIQKQLETTIGTSAKGVLYLAGERAAQEVLPAMADRLKQLPSGKEALVALQRMSDIWATIGAGRATVTMFTPAEGRYSFKIEDSTYPAAYGPSSRPVCHLWAGWAAGVIKRLFGRDVLCEEVQCRAMGARFCEFEIRPHVGLPPKP